MSDFAKPFWKEIDTQSPEKIRRDFYFLQGIRTKIDKTQQPSQLIFKDNITNNDITDRINVRLGGLNLPDLFCDSIKPEHIETITTPDQLADYLHSICHSFEGFGKTTIKYGTPALGYIQETHELSIFGYMKAAEELIAVVPDISDKNIRYVREYQGVCQSVFRILQSLSQKLSADKRYSSSLQRILRPLIDYNIKSPAPFIPPAMVDPALMSWLEQSIGSGDIIAALLHIAKDNNYDFTSELKEKLAIPQPVDDPEAMHVKLNLSGWEHDGRADFLAGIAVDVEGTLLHNHDGDYTLNQPLLIKLLICAAHGVPITIMTGGDVQYLEQALRKHGVPDFLLPIQSKADFTQTTIELLIDDTVPSTQGLNVECHIHPNSVLFDRLLYTLAFGEGKLNPYYFEHAILKLTPESDKEFAKFYIQMAGTYSNFDDWTHALAHLSMEDKLFRSADDFPLTRAAIDTVFQSLNRRMQAYGALSTLSDNKADRYYNLSGIDSEHTVFSNVYYRLIYRLYHYNANIVFNGAPADIENDIPFYKPSGLDEQFTQNLIKLVAPQSQNSSPAHLACFFLSAKSPTEMAELILQHKLAFYDWETLQDNNSFQAMIAKMSPEDVNTYMKCVKDYTRVADESEIHLCDTTHFLENLSWLLPVLAHTKQTMTSGTQPPNPNSPAP